jgi:hypothetical protein
VNPPPVLQDAAHRTPLETSQLIVKCRKCYSGARSDDRSIRTRQNVTGHYAANEARITRTPKCPLDDGIPSTRQDLHIEQIIRLYLLDFSAQGCLDQWRGGLASGHGCHGFREVVERGQKRIRGLDGGVCGIELLLGCIDARCVPADLPLNMGDFLPLGLCIELLLLLL